MKRLTIRNSDGTVSQPVDLKWSDALERLAEYEDTGLMPEEINRILDAYGRGMTLRSEVGERVEIVKDIAVDRLRELAQAEAAMAQKGIAHPGERVRIMDNGGDCVWADKEIELVGPVYRRKQDEEQNGHWEPVDEWCDYACQFRCSNCGSQVSLDHYIRSCEYEYCPFCGSMMDGEE